MTIQKTLRKPLKNSIEPMIFKLTQASSVVACRLVRWEATVRRVQRSQFEFKTGRNVMFVRRSNATGTFIHGWIKRICYSLLLREKILLENFCILNLGRGEPNVRALQFCYFYGILCVITWVIEVKIFFLGCVLTQ